MRFIRCHKCGHVHDTAGFYGKAPGQRCMIQTGTNLAKGSGGWIYCRAVLRASDAFEAENRRKAQEAKP